MGSAQCFHCGINAPNNEGLQTPKATTHGLAVRSTKTTNQSHILNFGLLPKAEAYMNGSFPASGELQDTPIDFRYLQVDTRTRSTLGKTTISLLLVLHARSTSPPPALTTQLSNKADFASLIRRTGDLQPTARSRSSARSPSKQITMII
jgi:hypothetical protein